LQVGGRSVASGVEASKFADAFKPLELVKDQDGTDLWRARRNVAGTADVSRIDADCKIETEVKQYVGVRFQLAYKQELRVSETDAIATGGRISPAERSKRTILSERRRQAPEVRSTCDGRSDTCSWGDQFHCRSDFTVQVDRIEKAACVLGIWSMDSTRSSGIGSTGPSNPQLATSRRPTGEG
jgi:hypothetical protein